MTVPVVAQIGHAIGVERPIALQTIIDGVPPLLLGGAGRDRAADDGSTYSDADCRADAVTSTAPASTTPASTTTASSALRQRRRDARGHKGASRGDHAECIHDQQRTGRQHACDTLAYGTACLLSSHIAAFLCKFRL